MGTIKPSTPSRITSSAPVLGVAMTGNIAGWSAEELAQVPQAERDAARARATAELTAAGAHLVIDSLADLPAAIADIEQWLAVGDAPG